VDAGPKSQPDAALTDQWLETLAVCLYEGIPIKDFIRADSFERSILLEVAGKAQEYSMSRDRLLANMIIEELSKAINKKR
jgi:hypothetical protein